MIPKSQYWQDVIQAISNQITRKDLKNTSENHHTKTPIDILTEKYKNKPEKDKIEIARAWAEYMGYHYDNNMVWKLGDVSPNTMYEAYNNWKNAGVCRHIHSEVAKLLQLLWLKSGTITTNTWARHDIAWWKKEDWSYFLIDYNNFYGWNNMRTLLTGYFKRYWSLDLKEYITDPNGKVIWIFQTNLEKTFEENTSSIWTWNSLEHSKNLASNWLNVTKGIKVNVDTATKSWWKKASIEWGNWNISLGAYVSTDNIDYANYNSYWLYLNRKTGERDWKYWELWGWIKVSKNNFKWNRNRKTKTYNVLSANLSYDNLLYYDGKRKIWLWWVTQWQIMQDPIINKYNKNMYWIEDGTWNFWVTLNVENKFNSKLTWFWSIGLWWDIWWKNIRSETSLTVYKKLHLWLGVKYKISDKSAVVWNMFYEKWLWYSTFWWGIHAKYWKLSLDTRYSHTKNKVFWDHNSIEAKIWITYNLTDALQVKAWYEHKWNKVNHNKKWYVWLSYKF